MSKQKILFNQEGDSAYDIKKLKLPKTIRDISNFELQFGFPMPIKYIDKRVVEGVCIKYPVRN